MHRTAGNYPRIPGITPSLGLVHYPLLSDTHRLPLRVSSRRSAPPSRKHCDRATDNMSQFRQHHMRSRRILLQRPAGLLFTVDNPMRRFHHPRACAPSCQQHDEVKIDGPTQFACADPLHLPTPVSESLLLGASSLIAGFPPCGRPRVGHSGEKRFEPGWEPDPTVVPSAS